MVHNPNRIKGTRRTAKSAGVRKGRFEAGMDESFASFNASISFDKHLYKEDVLGSIAHVRMLGRRKIIGTKDARAIEKGLREVLSDIEEGRLEFREDLEDIHINIEEALRGKIGDIAGKLHTARSRNDQVVLDLRMYVKGQASLIAAGLVGLMAAITDAARNNMRVIMPGYTHLQRAQPVRLSHHLMAYFQMFRRDWERFRDAWWRVDEMPLGSAALAGTTFAVDREGVAGDLGFMAISQNSMDAVSDRDFVVEFVSNSAMVMMHLSRLAEELVLWSSQEFQFCTLPDAFCSGSSIMPQKKNPDACELVRGKTGRVYGHLVALLTTLKALPLAYNKDLQEDKEPLFDTVKTVKGCLGIMAAMMPEIEFHGERMLAAASDASLAATDLADSLVRQGVPFREAHELVGSLVRESGVSGTNGKIPTPEEMVEARRHPGGTSLVSVKRQIEQARDFLARAEAGLPGQRSE